MDKKAHKRSLISRAKEGLSKANIKGFLNRYGFYIVLLLCVVIVGATAIFTDGSQSEDRLKGKQAGSTSPGPSQIVDDTGQNMFDESGDDSKGSEDKNKDTGDLSKGGEQKGESKGDSKGKDQTKGEDQLKTTNNKSGSEPDPAKGLKDDSQALAVAGQTSQKKKVLIMPVEGEILKEFTGDEQLVYSQTLDQWSFHLGLDIAAALESEVKAALDGFVDRVDEDPLRGIEIAIKHDNGFTTIYTGLANKDMVSSGQRVKQGQVIGRVGQTAAFEISDPSHLHFELLIEDQHHDPLDYIKD